MKNFIPLDNIYVDFKPTNIACVDVIAVNNKVLLERDCPYRILNLTDDYIEIEYLSSLSRYEDKTVDIKVSLNLNKILLKDKYSLTD